MKNTFFSLPMLKINSFSDTIIYFFRLIAVKRGLLSPSMYISNNIFILKLHLLLVFFFPVFLIMVIFFDSYLTIDYIFFFFTDEADFDDFIALIYMVLFFFLILTDYDTAETKGTNNINDFVENHLNNVNEVFASYAYYNADLVANSPRNLSINNNYYDKNFFDKLFMLSSDSALWLNTISLVNINNISTSNAVAKIEVNRYILDDQYALQLSSDSKFLFLSTVSDDDISFKDSSDLFVYSFYLILFDLELSRLFVFMNNLLLNWIKDCLNYLHFFNKKIIVLLTSNFEFSSQMRVLINKKNVNSMIIGSSLHKIYYSNYTNLIDAIDDLKDNNYSHSFFNRNN